MDHDILKKKLSALKENEALAPYTHFNIGGPARYFFVAQSNEDVIKAVRAGRDTEIPLFILGGGTNILVSDSGFPGLVIKMENTHIDVQGNRVRAEAGAKLQKLIRTTVQHRLSGMEHLIGIPGTVGGGIAGNVGTPEEWIDEVIREVSYLDHASDLKTIPARDCNFSYRSSRFKYSEEDIILEGVFQLEPADATAIQKNISDYLSKRAHQPVQKPCAGSTFKNPPGHKAWKLIDQAGLRGKAIGGAKVSEDHANFIINTGNATAEDVVILISFIKQQVRDNLGVQLNEEIRYIGF